MPEAAHFALGAGHAAFGVRRFDRVAMDAGEVRVPMLSLAALLDADYRLPALDYETVLLATARVTGDYRETLKAFESCVFNVLTHNRERLLEHEVAAKFFRAVVEQARAKNLMSAEHFSVDGTLIEAWASAKSFRPKDDDDDDNNGWSDFSGTKRRNDTHESKTDPESKLWRKGKGRESKLSYMGHALMENRNGLLVGFGVTQASGLAEREAALALLNQAVPGGNRITLGADRGYDCRDFVEKCRTHDVTPHVAQNVHQRSGIDRRTTRHPGYAVSIAVRRRIESIFGWLKTTAGLRRTRYRGRAKTELFGYLAAAAYNLVRISRLAA